MKTTEYKPISCANYEFYELAILRHRRLRLAWNAETGNVVYDHIVTPLDLKTLNGEEFLILCDGDDAGATTELRLDRIRRVELL